MLVSCQQLASILICVQQYFSAGEGGCAWPPRLYLASNSMYWHFPIAWFTSLASKQGTANIQANRRKVDVADKSRSTLDQDFSLKLQNKNNYNKAAVARSWTPAHSVSWKKDDVWVADGKPLHVLGVLLSWDHWKRHSSYFQAVDLWLCLPLMQYLGREKNPVAFKYMQIVSPLQKTGFIKGRNKQGKGEGGKEGGRDREGSEPFQDAIHTLGCQRRGRRREK